MFGLLPQFVRNTAKTIVRALVRWRLSTLPLSLAKAEYWAQHIKKWPAIYGSVDCCRRCCLDVGIEMDLGVVDVVERHLLTEGRWDPLVRMVLETYLGPGGVCVDIGANIGYFTLLSSKLVGNTGLVVACEPSVRALRKLTHHVSLNHCSNVLLLSLAMGEKSHIDYLNLTNESNIGASYIRRATPLGGAFERVMVAKLDDVVAHLDIPPTLLKLDVEGYEFHVLRGATTLLRQHRPPIVCELTDVFLRGHGVSIREVLEFMESYGYRCYVLEFKDNRVMCRPLAAAQDSLPESQVEVLFSCDSPRIPVL